MLLTCGTLVPAVPPAAGAAGSNPRELRHPGPFFGRGEVDDVAVAGTVMLAVGLGKVWSCGHGFLGTSADDSWDTLKVRHAESHVSGVRVGVCVWGNLT